MPKLKPLQKKCIPIFISSLLLAPITTQAGFIVSVIVNTTDDSGNDGPGKCSLRDALDITNFLVSPSPTGTGLTSNGCAIEIPDKRNEINFDLPEGENTITLERGELLITSGVSINGTGADSLIIDGNQESRVFSVSGAFGTRIDGLTVTGGQLAREFGANNFRGAGIELVNSDRTVLSNLKVLDNTASYYQQGGGIGISRSDNVTLDSVQVSGNTANTGGGITTSLADNLTIIDSEISGNIADPDGASSGSRGGGIQIIASGVTIENSTISANTVSGGLGFAQGAAGGGIDIVTSNVVINRSAIVDNQANAGGGLNVSGSDRVIAGVIDDIPGAGDTVITNSTISGNSAIEANNYGFAYGGVGGGVYVAIGHRAFFNNTTVTNNDSVNEGGGVYIGRPAPFFSYNSGPEFPRATIVNFNNTIVSGNENGGDCFVFRGSPIDSQLTQNNFNWFGDDSCDGIAQGDALLGSLSDNGGPTLTHAPLPNSGLIDAGSLADCQTFAEGVDQRNEPRGDAACFIGAVETIAEEDSDETLFVIPLENGRRVIFGL